MMLPDTFVAVQPAVVALISKAAPTNQFGASAPLFPPIIGTGFFVDRRGIVATNRHVVQCLEGLPKHSVTGKASAAAVVFLERQEGSSTVMGCLVVDVENYWTLENFEASSHWYGEGLPDLAFVKLSATATPALHLTTGPVHCALAQESQRRASRWARTLSPSMGRSPN